MSLCSIVIPVFNRLDLTRQCINSLRACGEETPAEVIVVDNASTDGTARYLRSTSLPLRWIQNTTNLSFAMACNQAARFARGEYLVLLNNDTIALPGWLDALVGVAEKHNDVAIVGSKLLFPNGTVQHAGVITGRLFRIPFHAYYHLDGRHPNVNHQRELRAVTGACMLIRRQVFEELGGLDESFQNGFEDVDICFKARARGYRVIYEPKSVLYHLEGQTPGRDTHQKANARRLQARWGSPQAVDEDLFYFEDHWRARAYVQSEQLRVIADKIPTPAEETRWQRIARVQAYFHQGGTGSIEALLGKPEQWPSVPDVLEWTRPM